MGIHKQIYGLFAAMSIDLTHFFNLLLSVQRCCCNNLHIPYVNYSLMLLLNDFINLTSISKQNVQSYASVTFRLISEKAPSWWLTGDCLVGYILEIFVRMVPWLFGWCWFKTHRPGAFSEIGVNMTAIYWTKVKTLHAHHTLGWYRRKKWW